MLLSPTYQHFKSKLKISICTTFYIFSDKLVIKKTMNEIFFLTICSAWFFLFGFSKFNICMVTEKSNGTNWDWDIFWNNLGALPTTNVNRALACQALNMLAICYMPGCIAAYIQLIRGTKYSRFPNFLDKWLKMRKYLGLLMLFSASMHVIDF